MTKLNQAKREKASRDKLRANREVLDAEAKDRSRRIKVRRDQRLKKEAIRRAQRRKRIFKLAGVWIGLIFIGFFAATWFSADFVSWLESFLN